MKVYCVKVDYRDIRRWARKGVSLTCSSYNVSLEWFSVVSDSVQVSSMLTQCSSPAENSDSDGNVKDSIIPEAIVSQDKSSAHLLEAPQQPLACPPQGLVSDGEAQNGTPNEHPLTLPDEIKGMLYSTYMCV